MQPDHHRLFVALVPTDPVRSVLTALQEGGDGVTWTAPAKIHLTLRFIGEVYSDEKARIAEALSRVNVRRFFLDLEGVGGFPARGRPVVLWAGVGHGHPLLHQLRQQVDDLLLTTQIPFELRAFSPHLTLGRARDATPVSVAHWLKRHREFEGPAWPIDSFYLMESNLSPSAAGPGYQVVRQFPLV